MLSGVVLTNPFLDHSDVVLVEREVLVHGFVEDEARSRRWRAARESRL